MLQGINGTMHRVYAGLERPQAPGAPSHWGGAPGPTMTSTFLEVLPLGSKVHFPRHRRCSLPCQVPEVVSCFQDRPGVTEGIQSRSDVHDKSDLGICTILGSAATLMF